ncbi:hypothetical protein V6R21_07700 [Limibacter armeniacum]|uniref:hypothetical protein n=1 Tax=Limibacter armeniacum TaxID=466084 RepID=UPI002FE62782
MLFETIDWTTIITSLVTSGIVTSSVGYFFKRYFDWQSKKSELRFNSQLQQENKNLELRLSNKLQVEKYNYEILVVSIKKIWNSLCKIEHILALMKVENLNMSEIQEQIILEFASIEEEKLFLPDEIHDKLDQFLYEFAGKEFPNFTISVHKIITENKIDVKNITTANEHIRLIWSDFQRIRNYFIENKKVLRPLIRENIKEVITQS